MPEETERISNCIFNTHSTPSGFSLAETGAMPSMAQPALGTSCTVAVTLRSVALSFFS